MSGAIRPDSRGRGAALLAGDLCCPGSVGCLLRGGELLLEISVALASAKATTRRLDLAARSLRECYALRSISQECFDPPTGIAHPETRGEPIKAGSLVV